MSDITNQRELREFCNLSGCEVWKAIQKLEEASLPEMPKAGRVERASLRTHCSARCRAYSFVKFLDTGNKKIARKIGREAYT